MPNAPHMDTKGVNLAKLQEWEESHQIKLPSSLIELYQKQNGGYLPGSSFYLNPLTQIENIRDYFGPDEVTDLFEFASPDDPVQLADVPHIFTIGADDELGTSVFIHLGTRPAKLYAVLDMEFEEQSSDVDTYIKALVTFEKGPSFEWDEHKQLKAVAGATLSVNQVENYLCRNNHGKYVLYTHSHEEAIEVFTKTVYESFDAPGSSIQPSFPAGAVLFLSGKSKEEICRKTEFGWKNEKNEDLGQAFMHEDLEVLRTLRAELLGEEAHQKLLQQEQVQSDLMAQMGTMSTEEQKAAGAAMGAAIMAEALKMMELDDEDDDEEDSDELDDFDMSAMMGDLMKGMQAAAANMGEEAAAGLSSEKIEEMQNAMKQLMDVSFEDD